ncbi:DNA cytosine methyltransferase [Escherichia coli]
MRELCYGSVCSGIEAASIAWEPLGMRPAWFAEIEPFPSAVLAHRWPHVANLGDMTKLAQKVQAGEIEAPDVLVGGTPCQAFSIPAIIQNIRAAQRRVSCDDLTARFFDNAVQSAEMLHAQLIDVYNAEADSHNSLVDAAENMQLDLGLKGKEIEELQLEIEHLKRQQQDAIDDATHDANQRADNAERISIELETKLNEMTAMVELRNSQISTLKSQYKEIMKLDPFNLEKRYNKAKSERQELRKQVADLNQQLKKTIKDASEARVAFANKKAEVTALVNENAKFATLKKEMYGITERRFPASKLHPTLGQISFFPRLLAYGISSPKEFNNERPYIVSKLDFAYQFCCDMGYAIDIRINEWLMPNFQPLAIFREFQPEGWVEFFHELICKEMESRRPELVRRVEWAQEVMLAEAELPFEPEFIDDLAAKGLHTLFDVVTRRHEQLVVELGLEETAARRLLDVCYARSDAWEKENGGTIYVR